MKRLGFSKDSFEVGAELAVEGNPAKDGFNRVNGISLTSNGKKTLIGGPGSGVPNFSHDGTGFLFSKDGKSVVVAGPKQ